MQNIFIILFFLDIRRITTLASDVHTVLDSSSCYGIVVIVLFCFDDIVNSSLLAWENITRVLLYDALGCRQM